MATMNDIVSLRVDFLDIADIASTRRAVFEVTPEGGILELPRGEKGDKGDKGDTANPVRMGAMVTTAEELPTNLGIRDANLCVPVFADRSLRVWTGYNWTTYPNWFGVKGDTGASQRVAVGTVVDGTDGSVSLSPASTDAVAVFDFVLPEGPPGERGEKGDVGPAASLSASPDVDMVTVPPTSGDVLRFNGAQWTPAKLQAAIGPFTLPASSFSVASVNLLQFGGTTNVIIGTIGIPAMPFNWRPLVDGMVEVDTYACGVDIEVRLGTASGPVVGLAPGQTNQPDRTWSRIAPYFESAVTPGNTVGVVNAGVATNLVVIARRVFGAFGSWSTSKDKAQLSVMCQPVVTAA